MQELVTASMDKTRCNVKHLWRENLAIELCKIIENFGRNINSQGGILLCAQKRKINWKTRMKMIKPILSLRKGNRYPFTWQSAKKNKRDIWKKKEVIITQTENFPIVRLTLLLWWTSSFYFTTNKKFTSTLLSEK
jgi:hypothetical protein